MRLIVAEDDKLSRRRLEEGLRRAGYSPIITSNGAEALRAFESGSGPALLLLDWVMPVLDGVAVCRRVRVVATAPTYVIFMSSRGRHENTLEALEAGADDFVHKPFSMEALLGRMRLGERVLGATNASRFLFEDALVDGLRSANGVVITRNEDTVGRVFLSQVRVAWAHVRGEPAGISHVLGDANKLSAEDIAAVIAECRVTKQHFADVLVAWKLVDYSILRERLRLHIASRLAQMAQFRDARALFIPEAWGASQAITFELEEVFERLTPTSSEGRRQIESSDAPPRSSAELLAADKVEGATAVCVIHGPTASVLARFGDSPDASILRALLGVLQVAGTTAPCEEMSLTDEAAFHFLQRVPGRHDRFVYARVVRSATLFAIARMQLGEITTRIARTSEDEPVSSM